jgi:hypothetical protein
MNCFPQIFFLSLFFLSSYGMERVPLVKKDSCTELQKYFQETIPSSKFSEIGKGYNNLPLKLRGRVILHMSDELRMLHRISLYLPCELQKKILVLYMGGYKPTLQIEGAILTEEEEKEIAKLQQYNHKIDQAIEKFCEEKFLVKAVELHYKIRKNIRESDSIAPLFVMKKKERIIFLHTLNPEVDTFVQKFINFDSVMSIETQKAIHTMDEDVREYFKGKDVRIINTRVGQSREYIFGGLLAIPVSGLLESIACCTGGIEAGCSSCVLGTVLGLIPSIGCILCMVGLCRECAIQKDNSNKVTL